MGLSEPEETVRGSGGRERETARALQRRQPEQRRSVHPIGRCSPVVRRTRCPRSVPGAWPCSRSRQLQPLMPGTHAARGRCAEPTRSEAVGPLRPTGGAPATCSHHPTVIA